LPRRTDDQGSLAARGLRGVAPAIAPSWRIWPLENAWRPARDQKPQPRGDDGRDDPARESTVEAWRDTVSGALREKRDKRVTVRHAALASVRIVTA
jgi:hypothetical protein